MKSYHHETQSNTKTHAQTDKSETKTQEEKHSWFMLQSAGHSTHSLTAEKRFLFPISWNLFTRCNVQIYYLWIIHQPGETFTNVITDEQLSGCCDNQESGESCLTNLQTLCQSWEIKPNASVVFVRRSDEVFTAVDRCVFSKTDTDNNYY